MGLFRNLDEKVKAHIAAGPERREKRHKDKMTRLEAKLKEQKLTEQINDSRTRVLTKKTKLQKERMALQKEREKGIEDVKEIKTPFFNL